MGQLVTILNGRQSGRVLILDIDKRFAQHSRRFHGGSAVFVDHRRKIALDLHGDFDRSFRPVRHHSNGGDVANGNTLKVHRLAIAQTFSIVKISNQGNFAGEKAACPTHEKNQNGEDDRSDNYGYSDAEFRPPELLLTRQLSVVLDKNHNRKGFKIRAEELRCRGYSGDIRRASKAVNASPIAGPGQP